MASTIFEKTSSERKGYTLPDNDVNVKLENCIPSEFCRKEDIHLPEVSELDVMRHFLELAHTNYCIEKGFYEVQSQDK
jgi:glycine dehydrogenase subunit 2